MTEKKGFVLYFDAASSLAALCAAQRGELLLALFDYAERWGRQQGMDYMEGPVGFCNLDKAALLTEGFDELSNTTALYNYPYYESHLLACGFEHCTRWVEKEMLVPKEVPEKIRRFSTLIRERNQLSVPDLHSKKALRRYIVKGFLQKNLIAFT